MPGYFHCHDFRYSRLYHVSHGTSSKVMKALIVESNSFIGFLTFSSISHAEPIQIYKPFEKLGRGIVNILTAPKEIPVQILASAVEQKDKHNNTAALAGAFSGAFKGIGWMVYRYIAGIYDVITFPFPIPTYEHSITEPEYVPNLRDVLERNTAASSQY